MIRVIAKEEFKMKKSYIKPEINFDSFGISSNFASACQYSPDSVNYDACGYTIHGKTIFVSSAHGCKYVSPDGTYGICYYVPTGDSNVFIS